MIDSYYLPLDRNYIRRTANIRLIPNENCGTGLMAIACEPFVGVNGQYTGIDVMKDDIDFCRSHYDSSEFEFIHLDAVNAFYAFAQRGTKLKWPVYSDSYDLVTALSVWTHLSKEDALFYFREIHRVLKPKGKAMITFFLLDEKYRKSIDLRKDQRGRFHMTLQNQWIFDQPSYDSNDWLHPKWAEVPKNAIGVTEAGLQKIISSSGMKLVEHHQGNWKEIPGVFFQDVLIFQKA